MLVITHKIYSSPSYTQTFGVLPTDGLVRFEVSLPLDRTKLNRGQSISDAMKPAIYCKTGRRLRWFESGRKTNEQLLTDLWNEADGLLVPPFAPSNLTPYTEVTT
jgi:hypothetical protein